MTKKKGRDKKKTNKKKPTTLPKAEPSKANSSVAHGPFEYRLDTGLSFTEYARPYSIFVNLKFEDGTKKQVGKIIGRFICRNNIRSAFWDRIQDVSPAAATLGFDIFDRHGNTRDEFVTGAKRGTGVWTGTEMNSQCLLLYETVAIDETIEDTTFIEEMFKRYFMHGKDLHDGLVLALVQPCSSSCGAIEDQTNESHEAKENSKVKEDKRVKEVAECTGGSNIRDESESGEDDQSKDHGEVKENDGREGEQKENLPIWNTLEARVNLIRDIGFRRIGTSRWFGKAYDENHPTRLLKAEEDYDPPCDPPEPSGLVIFEDQLERARTLKEHGNKLKDISDKFMGFSDEQTKQLLSLRGMVTPIPAHVFAKAKFGCTCNKCIDGILSPRMHFTLLKQVWKVYEQFYMDMSCDSTRQRLGRNPRLWDKTLVGVICKPQPAGVIEQIFTSKDFALGTSNNEVFRYIFEILKRKKIPTINTIKSAVRDADHRLAADPCPCCGGENISPTMGVAVYLMGGGTLKACLKGLLDYSTLRDEKAGDDTFHWRDNKLKNWDFAREYHALPRCRNDSEFGFVFKMLCKS